jgi:hypothetical protein
LRPARGRGGATHAAGSGHGLCLQGRRRQHLHHPQRPSHTGQPPA